MKFRVKMTLWMLALLSVLFGAGGSLLITGFFRDAMDREKDAAFASYRMAWSALQIVNGLDPYLDADAIARTMEQLCQQNGSAWTDLRLATESAVLYESGGLRLSLLLDGAPPPEPDTCRLQLASLGENSRWLVLSGTAETNGGVLYLHTTHDVTAVYDMRDMQRRTYLRVFAAMVLLCAAASYTMSRALTAPLTGLSRASRAIASGRFSSRAPVRGEDEIAAVARDFNRMAAQMEKTISELHQAMERQEQFVGSFAHEMKTPMTSLVGYAELLRSGRLSPAEQAEAADYLFSEGRRLSRLSEKLLDLLVVKEGKMALSAVSPAELVEEFVGRLRPLLVTRSIAASCVCQPGICLLEPDLVWSLLLNLADNAQKAMTSGGEIGFRLELIPDGCRIQVTDTGRGIPEKSMDRLTEAFYRVDKARSRRQGGFGLGLALCREIAALHNGSIHFANRTDAPHGACVTVELKGGRP